MQKPNTTPESSSPDLKVAEKLNYQNYTTWCKLMQIALEGRGRLNHITDAPLSPSDPTYQSYKQRDSIVLPRSYQILTPNSLINSSTILWHEIYGKESKSYCAVIRMNCKPLVWGLKLFPSNKIKNLDKCSIILHLLHLLCCVSRSLIGILRLNMTYVC